MYRKMADWICFDFVVKSIEFTVNFFEQLFDGTKSNVPGNIVSSPYGKFKHFNWSMLKIWVWFTSIFGHHSLYAHCWNTLSSHTILSTIQTKINASAELVLSFSTFKVFIWMCENREWMVGLHWQWWAQLHTVDIINSYKFERLCAILF